MSTISIPRTRARQVPRHPTARSHLSVADPVVAPFNPPPRVLVSTAVTPVSCGGITPVTLIEPVAPGFEN